MATHSGIWNFLSSRRVLARILSTIFCSIFLVVHPFSKYGGPAAFLVLAVKELVFSVQETLGQQLEITILHLSGGVAGIGLSVLGKYLATLTNNTVVARLTPALFLVGICFLAGWAKSRLPRLTLSSRIACFIAIWSLTTDVGVEQQLWPEAGFFLWIMLTAALTSLFSGMVLLRWSSTHLACEIASAFAQLHCCLSLQLNNAFSESHPIPINRDIYTHLSRQTIALDSVYQQAAFELRIGRLSVESLKPFIGITEHFRREISWGMLFPRISHLNNQFETNTIHAFHEPALELGHAVLSSLSIVEKTILACFERSVSISHLGIEAEHLASSKCRISMALVAAREKLEMTCNEWNMEQRISDNQVSFPEKIFDLCSFMISLLQIGHGMQHTLTLTEAILAHHSTAGLRLWHPRFSLAWLGAQPSTTILDERNVFLDEEIPDSASILSEEEANQGIAGHFTAPGPRIPSFTQTVTAHSLLRLYTFFVHFVWNHPRTMKTRLSLSTSIRSIERSPHLRHAFKNGAGVAILSIPAFLPATSSAREWFKNHYGQWMLISFVWVLETNTGATWRVAYLRLSGTVIGALYAFIASLICRSNPFALVIMTVLAELPITYVVTNTHFPSLGVVASVTLPSILYLPYFHPDLLVSTAMLAVYRGAMIAAGIIAALFMNSLFFPRHCRVIFLSSTCQILGLLSQLYIGLSRDLFHHANTSNLLMKRKSLKLELTIRQILHRISLLIGAMDDELSLVPKPIQRYRETAVVLQHILDLLARIRRIRENIPRKDTVEPLVSQRREFVSCVCISFFACEQVFKAQRPLPQFLPSARAALHVLEKGVEERIHKSRQSSAVPVGLPVIYAFAEINVLRELVDTIDDLLHLARQLFGTLLWYNISDHASLTGALATAHEANSEDMQIIHNDID